MRGIFSALVATIALMATLTLSACGGDSGNLTDASGNYTVSVERASFPAEQRLGEPVNLVLKIRNEGEKTMPNVAISIDSFSYRDTQPDLSDRERPIWIVDRGPVGGTTAFVSTWTLGELKPGHSRTFRWHVRAVKSGRQTLKYTIAPALGGDFKIKLSDGTPAEGTIDTNITRRPAPTTVGPNGQIER